MKRKQLSILFAGSKGTGKTTVLLQLVKTAIESGAKVCFVYNGTGEEKIYQFKQVKTEDIYTTHLQVYRVNYTSKNELLKRLEAVTKKPTQRIFLVFDDGMYFLKSKDFDLENILRTQRQRNLDIAFVTHGVSEIPAMFWGLFNTLFLFKTSEKAARNAYKIPDEILPEIEQVNKESISNIYYYKIINL